MVVDTCGSCNVCDYRGNEYCPIRNEFSIKEEGENKGYDKCPERQQAKQFVQKKEVKRSVPKTRLYLAK